MTVLHSQEPLTPPPLPLVHDEAQYELIDNLWVEMPPMGALAVYLASELVTFVSWFGRTHEAGKAVSEMLFRLPVNNGTKNRRLDGAFVSYQRWPKRKPIPASVNAWEVVPNLAIEVVSPNDLAEEIQERVAEYFRAGVELMWVVWPVQARVHVYESEVRVRILSRDDVLDGGTVLPGFQLQLSELFPPESQPDPA